MNKIVRKLNGYWWRTKYMLLDTKRGRFIMLSWAVLLMMLGTAMLVRNWLQPPEMQLAFPWLALAQFVISALVMYALRPKVEQPKPQPSNIPKVKDGASVVIHFGEVWPDPVTVGQQRTGTTPIRQKGGKK